MTHTITRMYANKADADAAVGDLAEHGFVGAEEVFVVAAPEAAASASDTGNQPIVDDIVDLIVLGRVLKHHAVEHAKKVAEGSVLVTVHAPFGSSFKATVILDRHHPVDSGVAAREFPRFFYDDAAPLSSLLGLPVLASDRAPVVNIWNLPTILPFSTESLSAWLGYSTIFHSPAPLSSLLSFPPLSDEVAPASSAFGMPVLIDNTWSLSKILGLPLGKESWLLAPIPPRPPGPRPAPLSGAFSIPVLSDEAAPASVAVGLPVLIENGATLSSAVGVPALIDKDTSLSSRLGLPLLV